MLPMAPWWSGAVAGPRVRCDAVGTTTQPGTRRAPVWRAPRGDEFPAAPLQVDGGGLPGRARPTHGEESDLEQGAEAGAQHQPQGPEEPGSPLPGPPGPPAGPQAGTRADRKAEGGWAGGAGGSEVQDREQQRLDGLPQAPQPVHQDLDGAGPGDAQGRLTNTPKMNLHDNLFVYKSMSFVLRFNLFSNTRGNPCKAR